MFLFTHGDAQYNVYYYNSDQPYTVQIARTVGTCVAHPAQNVTMVHELTYPEQVEDVTVDGSENLLKIRLINDVEDAYTFGEIESFFTGEDEEACGNDPVNHPNHYKTSSGLEAIDVIDAFTEDLKGYESVYTSQVLKYTLRWKHKNGVEDLEKANWYLTRLINKLKEADK